MESKWDQLFRETGIRVAPGRAAPRRRGRGAGKPGAYRTAVCHECKNHLDSRSDPVCPRCGWIICPDCGSCGCTWR